MPNADAEPPDPARRRAWVAVAIVVAVVAIDQLTKGWAVAELDDGPWRIIGDDVELRLTRNTGSAFSLFQGFTPLLAVLAAALVVLLVRALHRTDDTWVVVALALILGGAIGNLIDRAVQPPSFLEGAVVDFVSVSSFPTFNVADSAITVGAVLLIVRTLFGERGERDRRAERHDEAAA
ncbi:MAG: signal peptidase II [Acidimicrobiia bacterium]